jgi:hypothetical protein
LQSPPILTAPQPGDDLLLYIAATTHIVSTEIVVERQKEGHAFGVEQVLKIQDEIEGPKLNLKYAGVLKTSRRAAGLARAPTRK